MNKASDFVIENLGIILHDDKSYYKELYVLNPEVSRKMHLKRFMYYYENKGSLISQLNMSTGENLLLTILSSIENRLKKDVYGVMPSYIFLDEIELALHSSALRRLVFFLKNIAEKNNTVVLFSTHSIELIRSISPENIFYIQRLLNSNIDIINPCYPIYATRNLESSNYGHDYIIFVEDNLAKLMVDKILKDKRLLSNKRVLVIPVGGWPQVLNFANETIRSNLTLSITKILIILDRDIKNEAVRYLKDKKISFTNQPEFLPIESIEKFLLKKLISEVDNTFIKELNDYLFQSKSIYEIIKEYDIKLKDEFAENKKMSNGKILFTMLMEELHNIRKNEDDMIAIIIEYLFNTNNNNINELSTYLERKLK